MLLVLWPFPSSHNSLAVCLLQYFHIGFSLLNFSPIPKFQFFHTPNEWWTTVGSFFVELTFVPVEDIKIGFVLVKWLGQLMTAFFLWKSQSHFLCIYYYAHKLYLFQRMKGWFFEVDYKTQCWNRKINVSLSIKISCNVLPISNILSKKWFEYWPISTVRLKLLIIL